MKSICSGRASTRHADAMHMAVIGAAAATEYIYVRKAADEIGILAAEFMRAAHVELRRIVELGMAAPR